jgi:tetratricopeptide (TPR) repeat protein
LANKRKILENARKLAQKGAKEKALKEYAKLLKLDPGDAKLRLEIGDAHRRWGQIAEAIETYERVASQYAKDGFDARAVAVYKQIVTLDADYFDAYEPLAKIYERMVLMGEALVALQTSADGLNQQGDKNRALDLLRRMATIDPTNTASRMKVAELLRQEGRQDEAIAEYEQTAIELERQGDLEGAGRAFVAVLEMAPDHLGATVGVTRSMIAQNVPDKAVACARRVVKLAPDEVEHYEMLADTLRAAGQDDQLSEVYRGLADLYRQRGDEDRAREITQRYVSPDALAMEADVAAPAAPSISDEPVSDFGDDVLEGEGAFGDDELLGDELIDDDAISAVDLDQSISPLAAIPQPGDPSPLESSHEAPEPELPDAAEPEAPVAPAAPRPAPPVPADADPEQLLAEASVYLRYGKQDRAISHLEAVLAIEPQHRAALEKLGEACVELGDNERAVEVWLQAATQAQTQGDGEAFSLLRARIGAIDEAAAAGLAADETPELPTLSEDDTGEIEIDLDLDLDDDADADQDELSFSAEPSSASTAAASASSASLSTTTSQQIADDLEEADFYVQQRLFDEAEEIYQRVLAVAPSHPTALVRLGELAAARGQDPDATGGGPPPAASTGPRLTLDEPEIEVELPAADTADIDVSFSDGESSGEQTLETTESEMSVDLDDAEIEVELSFSDPPEMLGEEDSETGPLIEEEPEPEFGFDIDDADDEAFSLTASDAAASEPEPDAAFAPEPPPAPELEATPVSQVAAPLVEEPAPVADPTPQGVDLVAEIGGFEEGVATPNPDDSFDLAAELSDMFEDSVPGAQESEDVDDGFTAVFSAFKKGVSETLSEGDHQAHYDLGIAYKEMGLFDDAISEFRAAMTDTARRPECLHLMGICALDGGQPGDALEHLKELLACTDVNQDGALAAQYDIGRAYAALGEVAQARLAYQSVQALDPTFRDVASLLSELTSPSPAPPLAEEEDDGYESFVDFMGDDDSDSVAEAPVTSVPEPASRAPAPSPRLDASALAEAAAEVEIDAPIAMADALGDDDDFDDGYEPEVVELDVEVEPSEESDTSDPAVVEEPAAEKSGSSRRRKKKISFV